MTLMVPAIGDLFDQRYELLEALGSGGIGTVFKARQIDADRLVALKVLHAHIVVDEEFKLRFLREAQALAKLSHVNIVTVYHMGISETGLPYLVMELINGFSLRRSLSDGKGMAPARVFKIMRQLCSALACVHQAGIIHRDLKPENIVLLNEPEPDFVKIIDFGLVKMDAGAGEQKLTSTGILIGSINYMSPEQCQGKTADARSDIYALTVCMFEMLKGGPPFTADTPMGLMYLHANAERPELRLHTGQLVHPAITEFVNKGLAKDPSKRFQTAQEMEKELAKLIENFQDKSIAASKISAQTTIFLALAATLLLAVVLTAFALRSGSASQKKVQVQPADSATRRLVSERSYLQQVASRRGLPANKIRDLITYRANHGGSELALEASKMAVQIASKQSGEENLMQLSEAESLLGQDEFNHNHFSEALHALRRLISMDADKCPSPKLCRYILDAKGVGSQCYQYFGQKKEALNLAEQVASFNGELPGSGAEHALKILILDKRLKSARRIIDHVRGYTTQMHCLDVCSQYRQFDLCDICLAKARQTLSEPTLNIISSQNTDGMALDVQQSNVYCAEGKLSQARQLIERIQRNPDYQVLLSNGENGLNFSLVLAMRQAGLLDEALKFVPKLNAKDCDKTLLQADLLVMSKRYDEARKLLSRNELVRDPETGIKRTALSRLDDIESNKADYRKGLNDF